jgi:hypothetical protein
MLKAICMTTNATMQVTALAIASFTKGRLFVTWPGFGGAATS